MDYYTIAARLLGVSRDRAKIMMLETAYGVTRSRKMLDGDLFCAEERAMDGVVRDGEYSQEYLGDGVYVSHDGFQIWLRVARLGGVHEVALEPEVYTKLVAYVGRLKEAARVK